MVLPIWGVLLGFRLGWVHFAYYFHSSRPDFHIRDGHFLEIQEIPWRLMGSANQGNVACISGSDLVYMLSMFSLCDPRSNYPILPELQQETSHELYSGTSKL